MGQPNSKWALLLPNSNEISLLLLLFLVYTPLVPYVVHPVVLIDWNAPGNILQLSPSNIPVPIILTFLSTSYLLIKRLYIFLDGTINSVTVLSQ